MKTIYIMITLITITLLSSCTTSPIEILEDTPLDQVAETTILVDDEDTETIDLSDVSESTWGSGSALTDESFTLEEMLTYEIQDEFTAKSEYIMIMNQFNVTNPFSNIYQSEETHISLLVPLFEVYQIEVPEDTSSEHLFDVESLQASFEIGVIAEINNIAMYNLFLSQDLPEDVEDVFIRLRDASENHLAAFEKNLEKYS